MVNANAMVARRLKRSDTLDGLMLVEHAHRVANDMALVIAELEICRSRLRNDPLSSALAVTVDHLHQVCGVQRRLLPPVQGHVDLGALLGDLAEAVLRARAGGREIRLHLQLAPLRAESRFAWQIATLVAELLTNALKHGITCRGGQISLSLELCGRHLSCTVGDDGVGAASTPKGNGHGCRIVEAIAEDLGGALKRVTSAAGTSVHLLIPFPALPPPADKRCAAGPGAPRDGGLR